MELSLNIYPLKKQQKHLACVVIRGEGGRSEHLLGEPLYNCHSWKKSFQKNNVCNSHQVTSAYQHWLAARILSNHWFLVLVFCNCLTTKSHQKKRQRQPIHLYPSHPLLLRNQLQNFWLTWDQRVCSAFFRASFAISPSFLWVSVTPSLPSYPTTVPPSPRPPTCSSLSQISSLSSFQTWLSNAAEQHSNFSLTTSHHLPPQSLILLDSGSAYT